MIYSSLDEITTGELFKSFRRIVSIGYTKFYEMLLKLENLRLIDTKLSRKGKGKNEAYFEEIRFKTHHGSFERFSLAHY